MVLSSNDILKAIQQKRQAPDQPVTHERLLSLFYALELASLTECGTSFCDAAFFTEYLPEKDLTLLPMTEELAYLLDPEDRRYDNYEQWLRQRVSIDTLIRGNSAPLLDQEQEKLIVTILNKEALLEGSHFLSLPFPLSKETGKQVITPEALKRMQAPEPLDFNAIEPLIRGDAYTIAVMGHDLENTIQRYEKEYKLDLNPDFQRGHVWTKDQQIKFVEYLLRGGQSNHTIMLNYPKWNGMGLDAEQEGEAIDQRMVIVDGKQRLTAVRAFLQGKIKAFGRTIDQFVQKPRIIARHIMLKFQINDLSSKKDILKWYLQINEGATPHTEEELQKVRKMLKTDKS